MEERWTPSSWRKLPAKQQPVYPDAVALEAALSQLRTLPPLVTPEEVLALRSQLAEVAEGKRFLLQGGDCAERFLDCAAEPIEQKLRILLQMSLVLTWGARIPTLRIARMAGQFSKPRSSDVEALDGGARLVPAFRGDNINSFDPSSRTPDPSRLVQGYFHSAATLNYVRGLLTSGLGDINASVSHWDLGFVQDRVNRGTYKAMVDRILSALDFMRVCGAGDAPSLKSAEVYMSHEGLHLAYEETLTRAGRPSTRVLGSSGGGGVATSAAPLGGAGSGSATPVHAPAAHAGAVSLAASAPHTTSSSSPPSPPSFFNLGTHFLWIGDRTRQLDHAHVEYCSGIANPIGIKVGPGTDPAELVSLIRKLWGGDASVVPAPGRIVLITRLGAGAVASSLPPLLQAVAAAGFASPVAWVCDPMHGNTRLTDSGLKTRDFDDILAELRATFEIHRAHGSLLGGVHVELTGENVTECVGGPENLREVDLPSRYTTYCDPRLNYAQGMEMAFLIAQYLADEREAALAESSATPVEAWHGRAGEMRPGSEATSAVGGGSGGLGSPEGSKRAGRAGSCCSADGSGAGGAATSSATASGPCSPLRSPPSRGGSSSGVPRVV